MGKPRRAGMPWRILVHEYLGPKGVKETGFKYGKAFHIGSDEQPQVTEHSKHIALPGTEFDELVIGKWIHLEAQDTGTWWLNIGGVTVWVRANRDGEPISVAVYGPNDYAEPIDGCTYTLTWHEPETTDRLHPCQAHTWATSAIGRVCIHCRTEIDERPTNPTSDGWPYEPSGHPR